MVVSHIDQDHILGALAFLEENNQKSFIEIKEIWHNSYRHLQFEKEKVKRISEGEVRILKSEIVMGNSFRNMLGKEGVSNEDISVKQGSTLASLILEGGYPWNKSFDGKAVNCENKFRVMKDNFTLDILSPNTKKLKKLSIEWLRKLKKQKINFSLSNEKIFDDAYEFHMLRKEEQKIKESNISKRNESDMVSEIKGAVSQHINEEVDDSIINGSSISFILEFNKKRLLFLADAHPDLIVENLTKADKKNYNIVKLSHHGSKRNTTTQLAKILHSDIFLISTNGISRHSHPNFDSLAKVIYYQKQRQKSFYFNYETNTSQLLENSNWKKNYHYDCFISDGFTITEVEI
ncbi:ComEC/Rec2 family competence protein [Salimicrobium salexigens]|nr:hypothetical protein [Salimicrobium salexigens]